ncbi:MAG: YggT family protein, partial [Candidatus Delongbacteria bacterium]|nr:YggT family protein [Candidatus Delongbacteria bacterium]
MISYFFTFLSLLILARVIFSFTGCRYGTIYDFVYTYSEKILKPIRKFLPPSRVDWSPFVALIIIDTIGKLLNPLVFYVVNEEYGKIIPLFLFVFVSLLSSVTVLLIIIFVVKIANDLVKGQNLFLTKALDSITDPIIIRVRSKIPFGYKNYSVWLILVLLFIIKAFFNYVLEALN